MIPGKFLIFACQNRKYAIELQKAREVRVADSIVPMPGLEHNVIGIFNLRGKILQVKDLGKILHQSESELNEQTVLLYVETSSGKTTLVVDALLGICSSEEVQWAENHSESESNSVIDYFTWRDELIQVLSVDKIAA